MHPCGAQLVNTWEEDNHPHGLNKCLPTRKENLRGICQLPRMRQKKKANQQFGTPLVLLEWKGGRHTHSPTSTSSGSNQPWKRIQFSYSSIEASRLFLGNKYHSMKCDIRRCINLYSDVKHQKLYILSKKGFGALFLGGKDMLSVCI